MSREIDRLVAEALEPMPPLPDALDALDRQLSGDTILSPGGIWACIREYDNGDEPRWVPRCFSTDWAAMGLVIGKIQERPTKNGGDHFAVTLCGATGDWWCQIHHPLDEETGHFDEVYFGDAATAPLAVCIAALKSLGVEIPVEVTP